MPCQAVDTEQKRDKQIYFYLKKKRHHSTVGTDGGAWPGMYGVVLPFILGFGYIYSPNRSPSSTRAITKTQASRYQAREIRYKVAVPGGPLWIHTPQNPVAQTLNYTIAGNYLHSRWYPGPPQPSRVKAPSFNSHCTGLAVVHKKHMLSICFNLRSGNHTSNFRNSLLFGINGHSHRKRSYCR